MVPNTPTAPSSGQPTDPGKTKAGFDNAKTDTAQNFDAQKQTDSTTQPCPETEKWKLTEIWEVTKQNGSDLRQLIWARSQYINLDPNANPAQYHREYGRNIRLQARVEWVAGDPNRSLSGKPVYWHYQANGSNRTGLTGGMVEGFGSSGTKTSQTSTDNFGWKPVVEFLLSKYGGDKFDVYATDDPGYKGGLKAGTYEVWRKLYYELDCMNRPATGSYSDRADTAGMTASLKKAWVEVERTGTDNAPAFKRLMKDSEVEAWATAVRNGTGAPRYYHLVLLDTIAVSPTPVTLTFQTTSPWVIPLSPSTYLFDDADWLVSANYSQAKTPPVAGVLTTADLTLSQTGSPGAGNEKTTITLDGAKFGLDPTLPVTVGMVVKSWTELSGLQVPTGPATIIGVRWRERVFHGSDLTNSTLNTMIHEPGHAMGLAATTLPDGTAVTTTIYVNGHHCTNLSNGCVMFTANSVSTTLCPTCTDALRGRDLAALPRTGSDPFN